MGPLGWGIIGIGSIVNSTIAPAMVAEPICDLIAGASRDRGRADEFVHRFGARRGYTDYARMLADPDVDAVFIATPNVFYADQVVAAAEAGKHVLCDKPLALTPDHARRAVAACRDAGVRLGVNFHNRRLPWVQDTAAMIGAGTIGDVESVYVEIGAGRRHYDNWRADPAMSGLGTVHNVGVHGLDFLRVLLHADPVEVTAMFDHPPGSGEVEMQALITMSFDNGALAQFNCNEKLDRPDNRIEIHGTMGRIVGRDFTRSRVDGMLIVTTEDGETTTHYPAPEAHR